MSARSTSTVGAARDLRLAVAQSIAKPGDLDGNVLAHVALATLAADHGARLVLFPELSLTGYARSLRAEHALSPGDSRLEPLQALADARGLVVVVGAPVLSAAGLHIGALSLLPHAGALTYQKQFLHGGEELAFTPGSGGDPVGIDDQVVSLAICADVAHAEHPRHAAGRGATVYAASCFVTHEGYAGDAELLRQHARGHGMVVLMANHGAAPGQGSAAGRSAIWSDDGAVLACAPAEGEALLIASREQARWRGRVVAPR